MSDPAPYLNSILTGINGPYIAQLYAEYRQGKSAIDESWQSVFENLADDEKTILDEMAGASWTPKDTKVKKEPFGGVYQNEAPQQKAANTNQNPLTNNADIEQATRDSVAALMLIRAYRMRGHLHANLDPLGLKEKPEVPQLDPAFFGFGPEDYDRVIHLDDVHGFENTTLRDILATLKETYCGTVGVEFTHIPSPEEREWIQERIEGIHNQTDFSILGRKTILERLTEAEQFEQFLAKKYVGTKRFGIDGGESLIPAMEQILKRGSQLGMDELVIGMAHRGRLNVLTNVMGKSFTEVFAEFNGMSAHPDNVLGSGDVKYHLGTSTDREFDGKTVHLSLTANPSHLEAVNPVVVGKVRAKQVQKNDKTAERVIPLLLHGDAAFAGQGVTAETLMMSELPGYRVGGTIHFVINNQIGFTTMPKYGRSGPYPTDVAKVLAAPIFHVNGDDPEAVIHVARIATEFRQTFKKDVVIDMVCYRRFGHNEGDEPAFTQPIMYKKIKSMDSTRKLYVARLVSEGIVTQDEADHLVEEFTAYLEKCFKETEKFSKKEADMLQGSWSDLEQSRGKGPRRGKTAIEKKKLETYGRVITTIPDDFKANSKIVRQKDAQAKAFKEGGPFDWATGEALAFASLLDEGYSVRLSGQDCGRGTFSQRHAILYDQDTNEQFFALNNVHQKQGKFEVHDSPLSEFAVMGFEYGYSLSDPKTLVMWEAQFGDFVNGAQIMIDQFIASAETKWLRMSGLTLLLPHGFEGQGPEHSSARPERFLQLCAEDNMQVCNITTPANYFHALRRQMTRDFRKPLIIMTPKSLLRHKLAVSQTSDFTGKTTFHRFLWDDDWKDLAKPDKQKRIVLCTGKVYYDLLEQRRERKIKDITLLRLEQLYPFPHDALVKELSAFTNAEFIWCQEEPKNQGYWDFVNPYIETVLVEAGLRVKRPRYIGREASAAPATGSLKVHNNQQQKLIDEALA